MRRSRLTATTRQLTALAVSAGALAAAAPAAHAAGATYVALGDSYSAGEGVTPYLSGTNTTTNLCHRSAGSYAGLLSIAQGLTTDGKPKAGAFDFAACSGGTTHDLFKANFKYPGEGPQLDHLGTDTKVVTLTIGGNDLGFTTWAESCLTFAPTWLGLPGSASNQPGSWGCSRDHALLIKQTHLALDALAGANNGAVLRTATPSKADPTLGEPKTDTDGSTMEIHSVISVLRAIHARAPQAKIVLSNYPNVFGTDKARWTKNTWDAVSGYECDVTPPAALTYDYADATTGFAPDNFGANAIARTYGAIEQAAVAQITAEGAQAKFIDAQPYFAGHGNCDTQSVTTSGTPITDGKWINGISPTVTGSFHPSDLGHKLGYLPAFKQALGL